MCLRAANARASAWLVKFAAFDRVSVDVPSFAMYRVPGPCRSGGQSKITNRCFFVTFCSSVRVPFPPFGPLGLNQLDDVDLPERPDLGLHDDIPAHPKSIGQLERLESRRRNNVPVVLAVVLD
jgi:hypothetical protein